MFMQTSLKKYSQLLSRSTSLLLKLFIEITPFITSYSDEVLYFKRVLIEIKTFIIKKSALFMQTSLKTAAIYHQNIHFYKSGSLLR